jgi:hypothetical protein
MPDTSSLDVFAAVKVAWDDVSGLSDIDGPFFGERPKQNTDGSEVTFPYAVFESIDNRRTLTTTSSEYWRHEFKVHFYHETIEQAGAAMAEAASVIDAAVLTIANGSMTSKRRQAEEMTIDDKKVGRAAIEYLVVRRKALTGR